MAGHSEKNENHYRQCEENPTKTPPKPPGKIALVWNLMKLKQHLWTKSALALILSHSTWAEYKGLRVVCHVFSGDTQATRSGKSFYALESIEHRFTQSCTDQSQSVACAVCPASMFSRIPHILPSKIYEYLATANNRNNGGLAKNAHHSERRPAGAEVIRRSRNPSRFILKLRPLSAWNQLLKSLILPDFTN